MRSRRPLPTHIKPYIKFLREAGYYCTNNDKTDYNFAGDDLSYWDESGPQAHYSNRTEGQPFFAIFNFNQSHESSLFLFKLEKRRQDGDIPPSSRLSAQEVSIPPYLPDTPEIRQDIANYHDAISLMDQKIGSALRELEEAGLSDNTIIFYYSDHGGILPRSKRYIYDTGTRVPLIVYFPEKYRHLAPTAPGQSTDYLCSFLDLPPTVLDLANVPAPDYMQGTPLFRKSPPALPPRWVFLTSDRFDQVYKLNRAVTDGRFRYIRNFYPDQTAALQIPYPYQMASWRSWRKAWVDGKTNPVQSKLWQPEQPTEELYDTQKDPWEIENLAGNAAYQAQLETMRKACFDLMLEYQDVGLIPEPIVEELSSDTSIVSFANSKEFPRKQILELAFLASEASPEHLTRFTNAIELESPVERYWGLRGISLLLSKEAVDMGSFGDKIQEISQNDPSSTNQALAASILFRHSGEPSDLEPVEALANNPPSQAHKFFADQILAKCYGTQPTFFD